MEERLQKLLSSRGVVSRRTAERLIQDGRVAVNGVTASLGMKADPEIDQITIDGKPMPKEHGKVYLMLNKPRGYITTLADESGRKTVADLVSDCGTRVWPVGRLDMYSEGLLLLTNDGDFTYRMEHPSHEIEKEYLVRVDGWNEDALEILKGKIVLDGQLLKKPKVKVLGTEGTQARLSIVIHEGKYRQIRRMCEKASLQVLRLRRIREDDICLGDLKPGRWRYLTEQEIHRINKG